MLFAETSGGDFNKDSRMPLMPEVAGSPTPSTSSSSSTAAGSKVSKLHFFNRLCKICFLFQGVDVRWHLASDLPGGAGAPAGDPGGLGGGAGGPAGTKKSIITPNHGKNYDSFYSNSNNNSTSSNSSSSRAGGAGRGGFFAECSLMPGRLPRST